MKVVARQAGFYGGSLRRPGDVFDLAAGQKPGRWMEEVKGDQQEKPSRKRAVAEEVTTLSEMAAADPKPKFE